MKSFFILLLGLFLLSACDTTSLLETIYFTRAKFEFTDKEQANKFIYLCKKSETEEKTKQRAILADKYFQEGMAKIVKEFVDNYMLVSDDSEEKDSKENGELDGEQNNVKGKEAEVKIDMADVAAKKLTKDSAILAEQLEAKFQCVMIDSVELK